MTSANVNAWHFPLIYDKRTKFIFLLMSENNLHQKRKQRDINEKTHYSKILSAINQPYSNQMPFLPYDSEKPLNIIKKFTSDERIKNLPQDIKLVIVSSQKIQGELLKVSGALYDKNLLLIDDEVDWSSFIDTDYSSNNIIDTNIEAQITETNANTLILNTMKENLVTLKQNNDKESVHGIKNDE